MKKEKKATTNTQPCVLPPPPRSSPPPLSHNSSRANGLGPEGGLCLAAGIVGNSGALKELVVGDNKLGPRVATLVAASMRSGTSGCLRGFGFPAAARTTIGTSATNTAVEEVTAATEQ